MALKHNVNIVGKIDAKTGIARHTHAYIRTLSEWYQCRFFETRPDESDLDALPAGVPVKSTADPDAADALASIFTDVTSNGPEDRNWAKVPITKLKYAYSVFDSTAVPLQWADILNEHFDAVFVPSRFLVDVYRKSRVQKPVFHLPLAIDVQPFLSLPTPRLETDRPFTYCFIGSREPRKNIDLLVSSFIQLFDGNPDVALRIHCALDFDKNLESLQRLGRGRKNIEVTAGVLSDAEYLDLIASVDCFVSMSKGEGFSIVPREFLAAGKPVLLSDCLAHAEILADLRSAGEGLGFGIEADIPVPALYPHVYSGGPFGVQYDTYPPAALAAMAQVYAERASLFSSASIAARRAYAAKFDFRALSELYRSTVEPNFARKTSGDELEFGGISTSDANLLSRLTGANHSTSLTSQLREKPVKYVVIGNDGGFLSVFNRYVSFLTWATSEHPESVVLPDWRIGAMQRHWKTKTFTSFCYGTPEDGNLWLKLFEPLPYREYPEETYDDDTVLYRGAELRDDYNEKAEPWLTYIHSYKLYKSPGFQRWRNWYHLYMRAFVQLRPHLAQKIDGHYASHLRRFQVISAHIRHPSHGIEQPGARMPTVDLYCQRIREVMASNGLDRRNARIYLATDQDTVVEQMVEEFGEMVVFAPDAARTTKAHDAKFNSLSTQERMREGFQIQHLTAADPSKWSIKMAEEVLIDTFLLARGDHFVHVTSNIATAVSYINPRIKMHYCE